MKKIVSFSFLIFSLSVNSAFAQSDQSFSIEQQKTAAGVTYALLKKYLQTVNLQKLGTKGISEEKKKEFLSLFGQNVMVWDDLTPVNFPSRTLYNTEKRVEQLVDDYEKYFPKGIQVKVLKTNINFKNLPNNIVQVVIQRNISGDYAGEYFITNQGAILELIIELSDDFSSAKILGIRNINSNPISCPKCPVPAVVLAQNEIDDKEEEVEHQKNQEESQEKKAIVKNKELENNKNNEEEKTPDITETSEQSISTPKLGLVLSFGLAAPWNTALLKKPDLSKMNYDGLQKSRNKLSGFTSEGGIAYSGNLDAAIMFGEKKKIGLGASLFYNYSQVKFKYDTIHQEYKGQRPNNPSDFLRFYTAYNITENILMSTFGTSILFKYDGGNNKIGFYMHCGPLYLFSAEASSKYESTSDYEAVYQYNGTTYQYDASSQVDSDDWIITKKAFHASNPEGQTEAEYFKSLESFNVGINKTAASKSEKFKFKHAYGGLLRSGSSIPLSDKLNLHLGFSISYVTIYDNKNYNKPLKEEIGNYNSTLYAVNEVTYFTYGINMGITIKLYKTEKNKNG